VIVREFEDADAAEVVALWEAAGLPWSRSASGSSPTLE